MINLVAQQSPGLARNTESSCAPPFPESESEHSVNSREAIHPSPNMAGNVDEESNAEKIELYEAYWIQNTTAHGCSRLANTAKFQRFVWVLALLTCFVYVSIEVYNSFDFYYQYLTTTEINKINKPEIPFPAVTICNFNRWRKSHLDEDTVEQLKGIVALYSYDYVIPDLDTNEENLDEVLSNILPTAKPVRVETTTTTAPPVECILPPTPLGITYEVESDLTNQSTVLVGSTIRYVCTVSYMVLRDGDEVHTCTESGQFQGKVPMCVDFEEAGERYTIANNKSNPEAMAVSTTVATEYNSQPLSAMTLCFWIRSSADSTLGTVISYGVEGDSILSVIQTPQKLSSVYGLKYKLFGIEGRAITLTSYDQWNPFCLHYSTGEAGSKLYKFLVFKNEENGFHLYGDDDIRGTSHQEFPLGGEFVLLNEYENYINLRENRELSQVSSGAEIANVNLWSRIIPIEVMDKMLWYGNVYTMLPSTIAKLYGSLDHEIAVYNVSVSQTSAVTTLYNETGVLRVRRNELITTTSSTTSVTSSTTPHLNTTGGSALNATADSVVTSTPYLGNTTSYTGNNTYMGNTTTDSVNGTTDAVNGTADTVNNTMSSSNVTSSNDTSADNTTETTEETPFNYADFTRTAGWQLVDEKSGHDETERKTLLSCTYRGRKCDSRWFTHRFGAYGNCYTFNQDIPEYLAKEEGFSLPIIQDNAGPTGGLNMLLDVQTFEYAESTALNGNSELGLKFIIHAPYEVPVINSMGYAVGPGQKAFVGFDKTIVSNLEEPWGKCNESRQLIYNLNYTLEGCALECRLQKVVAACGCKPYYYPGDFDICSLDQLEKCAFIEIAKVNADFSEMCDCPIACTSEDYDVKLSYTTFPNRPYGFQLGEDLNITLPRFTPGTVAYENTYQYIKGNVINLDMYFEKMLETEMKQNKAMDITALLGNVGGQLGLFIGCSFLTAFEFLECIVMSTLYHCKRRRLAKARKKKREQAAAHQLEYGLYTPRYSSELDKNNSNNNGGLSAAISQQPLVW